MRLFDLSLRHKIPLWGSLLIIASALAISSAMMFRAYDDLRQDLLSSSESLGQTLAKTLFPALLHDDLWRAFEIVQAPFHGKLKHNSLNAEAIFVINEAQEILVSSDPRHLPTLTRLGDLDSEHQLLAAALRREPLATTRAFDLPGARHYFIATSIAEAGKQIGTLVISHDRAVFWTRFIDLALRGALIGTLVVAIILPINWYWGRRMAEPLVELAHGMEALVHGSPAPLPAAEHYAYRDELGQLFSTYREAASALNEKALLEQEMMRTERLAAVGRLAAGIAHEVNNPLGGMLMALDNLKQRGPLDAAVEKTMSLLERGLQHVTETVGALLVEARATGRRPLNSQDFDDLRMLVEPQTTKKGISLGWHVSLRESMPLPSHLVRQLLLNLLLNALQATETGGQVSLAAVLDDDLLRLQVANSGSALPEAVRAHLFEPFVAGREGGHGLGLWVVYQIVTQLKGHIAVESDGRETRFIIAFPLEKAST